MLSSALEPKRFSGREFVLPRATLWDIQNTGQKQPTQRGRRSVLLTLQQQDNFPQHAAADCGENSLLRPQ